MSQIDSDDPHLTLFSFFNVLNLLSGIDDILIPAADFFKFVNETYQSNNSFQVREILIERINQLKSEEQQILDRLDIETHAIHSLKMELERLELSVSKLREDKRCNHISKKCAEAALSYISEHLSETQIANIMATAELPKMKEEQSSITHEIEDESTHHTGELTSNELHLQQDPESSNGPLQSEGQLQSQSPLTYAGGNSSTATENNRFTAFLWFLTSGTKTPHTEIATKEALIQFFKFLYSLSEDDLSYIMNQNEEYTEAIIGELNSQIRKQRPDFQALFLQILAELFRYAPMVEFAFAHQKEGEDSCVQTIINTTKSINDDVTREASNCIIKLAQTLEHKIELGKLDAATALVDLLWRSQAESVLEASVTALWHFAIADENKALVREAGGIEAVCALLKSPYEGVLENATIALGYLTRDDENKAKIRECDGLQLLIEALSYPNESIQSKAAGALWNCASNTENKLIIRKLGGIDALIGLLNSIDEHTLENTTGALWNCAVHTENKKEILKKGGIPKLINILNTTKNEAILENVSGTIWNCATIGEIKVLMRKINGLDPLLKLLYSPNPHIRENAAGAIRNCAINDQNKETLRKLGGIKIFVDLLLKSDHVSILEKIASTLWICSIDQENKVAIREHGAIPILIQLLNHKSLSVVEKALGTLRNCSTIPENKIEITQCNGLPPLIHLLSPEYPTSLNEYAAATIWNLARNDNNKKLIREYGGIQSLIETLKAAELENTSSMESIQENVAGALLTLTLDADNRNEVRSVGGLQHLVRLLDSKNEYVLENAISALKNCAANDTNIIHLRNVIPRLIELLESKNDSIVRESALCLKNLSLLPENAKEIGECQGIESLLHQVTNTTNEQLRKILVYTIQALAKSPENMKILEKLKSQPNKSNVKA